MTDRPPTTTATTLRLLAPREIVPSIEAAVADLPAMFAASDDEVRTFCGGWSSHMPAVLAIGRRSVGWLRIDPASNSTIASAIVSIPAVETLLVTPTRLQPAPEPRSDITLAAGGILVDVLGAPEQAAARFKDAFAHARSAQAPTSKPASALA